MAVDDLCLLGHIADLPPAIPNEFSTAGWATLKSPQFFENGGHIFFGYGWDSSFGFHFWDGYLCYLQMSRESKAVQPADRLVRMRKMFAKSGGILVEDYEHFTRQGASTPPSKAARKLVKSR